MKPPFIAPDSPYLAPFDGSLEHQECPTGPPADTPGKKALARELKGLAREIDQQQRMLYAQDRFAVLLVFQALDAAGKDGTIRAVFNRVDPNGLHVASFKAPTDEEVEHDFLWRTSKELPRRGSIGVFNRSYFEEVLVVRVHPEFLGGQNLPPWESLDDLWEQRYEAIRQHELHLAQSGTVVIKFWLKHSREEQRQRFLDRLTEPEKNWKFSERDVEERGYWDQYMQCYQDAINATSRPWAPWYVLPADNKPYMRLFVAKIVRDSMASLGLAYPSSSEKRKAELELMVQRLENEGS